MGGRGYGARELANFLYRQRRKREELGGRIKVFRINIVDAIDDDLGQQDGNEKVERGA